jgi:hypothetical protein
MAVHLAGMYEMISMKRQAAELSWLNAPTPETVPLVIGKES